jgi:hypothetical protein
MSHLEETVTHITNEKVVFSKSGIGARVSIKVVLADYLS